MNAIAGAGAKTERPTAILVPPGLKIFASGYKICQAMVGLEDNVDEARRIAANIAKLPSCAGRHESERAIKMFTELTGHQISNPGCSR